MGDSVSGYAQAWAVYLLSTGVAVGVLLYALRRWIRPSLRQPVAVFLLVLAWCPMPVNGEPGWYVPVAMAAAMALLDEGAMALWTLMRPALWLALTLALAWSVVRVGLRRWGRRHRPSGAEPRREPVFQDTRGQQDEQP
jgi:hypothetical protein